MAKYKSPKSEVEVLEYGDVDRFKGLLQERLDMGFKLSSSNCFCDEQGTVYQAVLIKE